MAEVDRAAEEADCTLDATARPCSNVASKVVAVAVVAVAVTVAVAVAVAVAEDAEDEPAVLFRPYVVGAVGVMEEEVMEEEVTGE